MGCVETKEQNEERESKKRNKVRKTIIAELSTEYQMIGSLALGKYGELKKIIEKQTGYIRNLMILYKEKVFEVTPEKVMTKDLNNHHILDNPHVCKVFRKLDDQNYIYIITDPQEGSLLYDYLCQKRNIDENQIREITKQILAGIKAIHEAEMLHWNLRPENIHIMARKYDILIKIINVGKLNINQQRYHTEEDSGSRAFYTAPELFEKQYQYTEKCDIWQIGVILHTLLSGTPPFMGISFEEIKNSIMNSELTFQSERWGQISSEAKDLLRSMLEKNPSKRPTASEALEHKWFQIEQNEPVQLPIKPLKQFYAKAKLQWSLYEFMFTFIVASHNHKRLEDLFKKIDKDGNGTLSRDEIERCMYDVLGQEIDTGELEDLLFQTDRNKNGVLDHKKFVESITLRNTNQAKEKLEKTFSLFDKEGDGLMSIDELRYMLGNVSQLIGKQAWEELILQADENGDGDISLIEFKHLINYLTINNIKFMEKIDESLRKEKQGCQNEGLWDSQNLF